MNWESLKVFLAIAESGSLAGAAKTLGFNHSTVFRKLQALELDAGAKLLEKIDNRYVLTTMGEEVLAEGQGISQSFARIERRMLGAESRPKGSVKITAPFNIANQFLPKILQGFYREYPGIKIEILSSNQDLNLNNRQADIAIRATSKPAEHLVGRRLAQIPWSVFASQEYLNVHGEPQSLDELGGHQLIGGLGEIMNLPGLAWLEKHHSSSLTLSCDELTAMSNFAMQGHGLAFLPNDQEKEGLVKLMDFPPGKTSDLWLLTHPDLRRVKRVRLVVECLTEQLGKHF